MRITTELGSYIIFGLLTTIINIVVYFGLTNLLNLHYQLATIVAWVTAVIFAYITNKKYVFKDERSGKKNIFRSFMLFIYYRLLSLIIDLAIMYSFIEFLKVNDLVTKVIANIVVIIFNYITSKLHVFTKRKTSNYNKEPSQ